MWPFPITDYDKTKKEIDELEGDIRSKKTSDLNEDQKKSEINAIKNQIEKKQDLLIRQEDREKRDIVYYSLSLLLLFSIIPIFAYSWKGDCFLKELIYIGSSGGLGGTVYSMLGFVTYMENGKFDLKKKWWYIFRPLTAVVLGVFSFLFIAGGVMSFTTADLNIGVITQNLSTINSEPIPLCLGTRGIMGYCAIAFLVGLSNNAFVRKLKEMAKTLFSTTTEDESDIASLNKKLDTKFGELTGIMKEIKDQITVNKGNKHSDHPESGNTENPGSGKKET